MQEKTSPYLRLRIRLDKSDPDLSALVQELSSMSDKVKARRLIGILRDYSAGVSSQLAMSSRPIRSVDSSYVHPPSFQPPSSPLAVAAATPLTEEEHKKRRTEQMKETLAGGNW